MFDSSGKTGHATTTQLFVLFSFAACVLPPPYLGLLSHKTFPFRGAASFLPSLSRQKSRRKRGGKNNGKSGRWFCLLLPLIFCLSCPIWPPDPPSSRLYHTTFLTKSLLFHDPLSVPTQTIQFQMYDLVLLYGLIALSIAILVNLLLKVLKSGFFDEIKPVITESPEFLSDQLTVFYKYRVGPYKQTGSTVSEIKDILPAGVTTFGIFYDDPSVVEEQRCQSAVGVIFGRNGKDEYQDNYATQLVRYGYERMILPKVSKAVQVEQANNNFLSIFALVFRTYGILKSFVEEQNVPMSATIEFYSKDKYHVLIPLDHAEEFIVHEFKNQEALDSQFARKKFDSDESDSQSEAEVSQDEDEKDK